MSLHPIKAATVPALLAPANHDVGFAHFGTRGSDVTRGTCRAGAKTGGAPAFG